jgi:hypothetical protein
VKITCSYSNDPPFLPEDHATKGLGGTENFACYVAHVRADSGHEVSFYNRKEIGPTDIDGIKWANLSHYDPREEVDVLISFRMREVFRGVNVGEEDEEEIVEPVAKLKVLILADTESHGLGDDVREGKVDVVMPVGAWQMTKIAREEDLEGHECWMPASNGIDMSEFELTEYTKQPGKCIHCSTPERGLDLLLDLWPSIEQAELLKDADVQPELHLFSSFLGWGMSEEDNENMCRDVYARIEEMKKQGLNIVNHKHVPRDVLRVHQLSADLFLYPTMFNETYCISLTEAQAAGIIPVVSNRAALFERVIDGINGFVVGSYMHDATTQDARQEFINKTVTALWLDEDKKKKIRETAVQTAVKHDYHQLVPEWAKQWESRIS